MESSVHASNILERDRLPAPTSSREGTPARSAKRTPRRHAGVRRRTRSFLRGFLWIGLTQLSASCNGLNIFSLDDDRSFGQQAYQQILESEATVGNGANYDQVVRVTGRLVEAARYEQPELVNSFDWEARLIQNDETVNAFCLPGGKMAVYTGILPVAQGENGLAVVMGHEIAHATHRHGTKAMTRAVGLDVLISFVAGAETAESAQLLANLAVTLPMGRGAELEADAAGLRYMARAGYDPREAVDFWERMAQLGGSKPPELLSTHPSDDSRIDQLQALMPEAVGLYERALAGEFIAP